VSAAYLAHREADIALRDGSTVHVRPIRTDDEGRLLDLLTSLSPDARRPAHERRHRTPARWWAPRTSRSTPCSDRLRDSGRHDREPVRHRGAALHAAGPEGAASRHRDERGGPAILCAETCEAEGLVVAPLAPETTARLRALLPADASVANPVDMLAAASAEQYRAAITLVARDPGVDAVIAIFIQPLATQLAADGHAPTGFLVQRMIADGVEMIVGLIQDPSFGPVLACGARGVTAELIQDVSVRLTPLPERDPSDMVRELRTYPLLCGYRGAPSCDVAALEDVLRRLATLAEDLPQVVEMDCNPLKVSQVGAVVDARIRVAPVEAPRPLGARR
jgi:acyl-CoA synthetase (NDP forming)